jgi:hypothetical protein
MPRRRNKNESECFTKENPSDDRYMSRIFIDGIEPELQSLTHICLCADSTKCDDCLVAENTVKFKDYSVSQEWHRPYVEAFFGTDEAKRGAFITEAERAIVDRFLELSVSSNDTEEMLDLQNAAYAITELRKANTCVYTPQHLVA